VASPFKVHELAEPLKPGFFNRFQELWVRQLQPPLPSQNLLLPHEVVTGALLPPPQLPFDWQLSSTVHTFPSLQRPVLTANAGQPLAGTQVAATWH